MENRGQLVRAGLSLHNVGPRDAKTSGLIENTIIHQAIIYMVVLYFYYYILSIGDTTHVK